MLVQNTYSRSNSPYITTIVGVQYTVMLCFHSEDNKSFGPSSSVDAGPRVVFIFWDAGVAKQCFPRN